jgi:dCMP deaminase
MANQLELDQAYMDMAWRWSKLSRATRKQVGALVVKGEQIISDGFNGTPHGFSNGCEGPDGETLPEVLHAESNALTKLARGTQSSDGATLYVTLSPCFQCAKLIIQSGIRRVICGSEYSDLSGVEFLRRCGITVEFTQDKFPQDPQRPGGRSVNPYSISL